MNRPVTQRLNEVADAPFLERLIVVQQREVILLGAGQVHVHSGVRSVAQSYTVSPVAGLFYWDNAGQSACKTRSERHTSPDEPRAARLPQEHAQLEPRLETPMTRLIQRILLRQRGPRRTAGITQSARPQGKPNVAGRLSAIADVRRSADVRLLHVALRSLATQYS